MNLFIDIEILNATIGSKVIFIIFIILAGISLLLFLLNLFLKPQKNKVIENDDENSKRFEFETGMKDVESEISLVLQIQLENNLTAEEKAKGWRKHEHRK